MAVVANDGVAGGSERRGLGSSTAAAGEVVGNDSMVVGRGIMIKGDVDNCAVRYLPIPRTSSHFSYMLIADCVSSFLFDMQPTLGTKLE